MTTDVALIGGSSGVVAEVEVKIVIEARHLFGLVGDAHRPPSGLTTPLTIAARVHPDWSIHFINRNQRPGFHEQAVCTYPAYRTTISERA